MDTTKDIGAWIQAELANDPVLAEAVSKEELNADIAEQLFNLREQNSLTQKELAEKSNTTQSVISRIEDSNYGGRSLALLHKIAWALNRKLVVKLIEKDAVIYVGHSLANLIYTPSFPSVTTGTPTYVGTALVTHLGTYQPFISGSANSPILREKA
jgi:DNA-binding XRE family transcriptional regulator